MGAEKVRAGRRSESAKKERGEQTEGGEVETVTEGVEGLLMIGGETGTRDGGEPRTYPVRVTGSAFIVSTRHVE